MSALFSPFKLGNIELANRIVVAPMCQYSAVDGRAAPWHEQHLGQLMCSGAGAVTIEATAVQAAGRVTHGCLGLWNDTQEGLFSGLIQRIRTYSDTPIGIQLNHAGRKASAHPPWKGGGALGPDEGAWPTLAPSRVPWGTGWPLPDALSYEAMMRIENAFLGSAIRAERAGFDFIELHGAHGYLLHSFLSPISNRRQDEYGGSLQNRIRFPLRILAATRKALSPSTTLGMRINGTDWLEDGWTVEEAQIFAQKLEQLGADYISVSSGGACASVSYPLEPGYQVDLAARVGQALDSIPVICAGLISDPQMANDIVASGKADCVAMGRAFLDDPRWPIHAAVKLGDEAVVPNQYMAIMPGKWRGHRSATHP